MQMRRQLAQLPLSKPSCAAQLQVIGFLLPNLGPGARSEAQGTRGMLPSYHQASGGGTDEEETKRGTARVPLLNVRKQIGRSAPAPTGLIILTVACSLLLLVQVCACILPCRGAERSQLPADTAPADACRRRRQPARLPALLPA